MKEPTNRGWRVSLIKAEALGLIQRALVPGRPGERLKVVRLAAFAIEKLQHFTLPSRSNRPTTAQWRESVWSDGIKEPLPNRPQCNKPRKRHQRLARTDGRVSRSLPWVRGRN
jgi:hypothetical protein